MFQHILLTTDGSAPAERAADFAERPAGVAIIRAAENRKPDLVVIGGCGLGIWESVFLGSVSMAVAQRAKCPVLIVKQAYRDLPAAELDALVFYLQNLSGTGALPTETQPEERK